MSRLIINLVLAVLLVIPVFADNGNGQIITSQDEVPEYEEINAALDKSGAGKVSADATGSAGPPTEITSASSYTAPDGTIYKDLKGVTIDNEGNILSFQSITMPDGTVLSNGNGLDLQGRTSYRVQKVDNLDKGIIKVTNGVNVQWNNGVLTADSASSFDYKGSTSTDVVTLSADGREFSVQRAAAVQAGCFLVEDVKIAKFVVNNIVTMTTSGDGKVVYGDGSKVSYDGLSSNSSLSASVMNCRKPTYTVTNMELSSVKGNLTEYVNGSGQVEFAPEYGVVCVNLTPVSTYDVSVGRFEDDFGFVIRDYAYKLCIQKSIAQKLVADCPLCGLVDLANNKLLLNGIIEYRRYWHDSALIDSNKRTAFRSLGFGKNIIDLARGDVRIEKDAPGIGTYASNFVELHEHDVDGSTRRFLGINEKVSRVSNNWAKAYTTSYAQATTTIENNHLNYLRADCRVQVLPPNSPKIAELLSDLQKQEVLFP
jgi:hypothetical protein